MFIKLNFTSSSNPAKVSLLIFKKGHYRLSLYNIDIYCILGNTYYAVMATLFFILQQACNFMHEKNYNVVIFELS